MIQGFSLNQSPRLSMIHAPAVNPLVSMNTTLHCLWLCGTHNIYIAILIILYIFLYCSMLFSITANTASKKMLGFFHRLYSFFNPSIISYEKASQLSTSSSLLIISLTTSFACSLCPVIIPCSSVGNSPSRTNQIWS